MNYPQPGTPEFGKLPKHVQQRILRDIAERKFFAKHGYLDQKPNPGKTHVRASKVSFCTGRAFYA